MMVPFKELRPWPASLIAAGLIACGPAGTPTEPAQTDPPGVGDPTATQAPAPTQTQAPELTDVPTLAPPTAEVSQAPAPTPTAFVPSDYIYTPAPEPEPSINTDELGRVITDALTRAFDMPAAEVHVAYSELITGADRNGCPFMLNYDYPQQHEQYWAGECTAASGTSFTGEAYIVELTNQVDPSGLIYNGYFMALSGGMESIDGLFLDGAGEAIDLVGTTAGLRFYLRSLNGVFLSGQGESYVDGLDGEVVPSMAATVIYSPPIDGKQIAMEGGLGGMSGEIGTMALSNVTLGNAAIGFVCPAEPTGIISLRDRQGDWYDVVFDTPTEADENWDSSLCDGCGDAWFRGRYVGTVCADFSSLLSWEGAPW